VNGDPRPCLPLPEDLTDEDAAALIAWLYEVARLRENHYAGQLLRHHHRPDARQRCLWPEDEPPF